MKTILSFVLAAVLLFGTLPFAAFAQQQEAEPEDTSGDGWVVPDSPEVTDELQAIFDQAMEGFLGVSYIPLALTGEQPATEAGYRYLCQATVIYPNAEPYFALVTIRLDEEGKAKIEEIETLETKSNSEKAAFAGRTLTNGDLKLTVPEEFADLLLMETPAEDAHGVLFSFSEIASIEAWKAQGHEDGNGAGWLFSISRVDEETLHQMLCYDMLGSRVFAKDEKGNYYLFNGPTDVRFVRDSYEGIESGTNEGWKQWQTLNAWANAEPEAFLEENPGLVPYRQGNSDLDIMLARIAWWDDTVYTISTTEYGTLSPGSADPAPFLDAMMNGVTYEYLRGAEAPDGEYVVLYFPEQKERFDFFLAEGQENVIRRTYADGYETFYHAVFDDGETKASEVMLAWAQALAKDSGISG